MFCNLFQFYSFDKKKHLENVCEENRKSSGSVGTKALKALNSKLQILIKVLNPFFSIFKAFNQKTIWILRSHAKFTPSTHFVWYSHIFPIYDFFWQHTKTKQSNSEGGVMRWLKWRLNSDKYIRIMFQFCFLFLMIRKMETKHLCHVIHHWMAITWTKGWRAKRVANTSHAEHYALNA